MMVLNDLSGNQAGVLPFYAGVVNCRDFREIDDKFVGQVWKNSRTPAEALE
jgi:hypothetical protein